MLPCVWPVARTSPNVTMPRSERLRINRPNPCRRDNAACGTWYSSIVGCSPPESRSRIAFDRQRSATSVHSHRRGGVSRRPVRTTGQHRLVLSRCERDTPTATCGACAIVAPCGTRGFSSPRWPCSTRSTSPKRPTFSEAKLPLRVHLLAQSSLPCSRCLHRRSRALRAGEMILRPR